MQKKIKPEIIALIPARSGSKGVKNKNIKKINNRPLIYYSIKAAQKSKFIDRIIVSTDSKKIANIANKLGAETPFLRPKNISKDKTLDYPVIEHFLKEMGYFNARHNVIIVFLRPTMPLRSHKDIDKGLDLMLKNKNIGCVRSVRESTYPPFWQLKIKNNIIRPFIKEVGKFQVNHRRQDLPKTYVCDGYIDAIRSNIVFSQKKFPAGKVYAVKSITKEYVDIDTYYDFKKAKELLKKK